MNNIALTSPLRPTLALLALALTPACIPPVDSGADGGTGGSDDAGSDAPDGGTVAADSESGAMGDCTEVTQDDLAADLTLPEGCYFVTGFLSVDGVTLSIEAGAEINFDPQAALAVGPTGVLSAVGVADNPVVMQGTTEQAGSWRGLSFLGASSSSNRLEFVELSNAGLPDSAAIDLTADARLDIANSNIQGSAAFAISAAEGSELNLQATTATANAQAIRVGIDTVQGVAADNALTGNDEDVAHIDGSTLAADATWVDFGLPLHPEGIVYVNAALTLEPGVTIAMSQDQQIEVGTDGSMSAVGTAESPVVFTGQLPEVGYWQGISYASKSSSNVLEFATLEFAGGEHWHGGQDSRSAVYVRENAKVIVRDTTISDSAWYALTAVREAEIEGFSGNRLARNVRVLNVHPDLVGSVEVDNEFIDNEENVVRMTFSNNDVVVSAQVWKNIGVPFHVSDRTHIGAEVTVEAGVTIEFEQEVSFVVAEAGSMNFEGTAEAPILLTGVEKVAGYWKGIQFGTLSTANAASHTRFEYAGGDAWHGGADASSTLYVHNEGRLELSDVTVAEGAGHGIKVADDGSALVCAGMTFENLEGDTIYGPAPVSCQ